jgi:hypothetical protein
MKRLLPLSALALSLAACDDVSAGGAIAGGIGLYAIGSLILLALLVYAVVDLVKQPYSTEKKLIWGAVILFIPYLGAILYLLLGKDKQSVI